MAFNSNIKGYMTFGKSFSRGAAFPLEAYEIWTDYDALVAYAANTDPNKDPSYIGQKVAYVDLENNKVTHYGIEIDGSLKELGAVPVGDGKSISVDANGAISLLGVEDADSLTLPRMKEDKSGIEWVPVSAVVEGDGNDNTTYTFTPVTKGEGEDAETYGFIVKTFFNGVAVKDGEFTIGFDVYTKSEVDAAIKEVADLVGVPAEGDDSTDTLYERIAAEVLRATNAESALSDRIGVAKNGENAATGVYAYVDGVVNALVNGVDPDKIDSLNELIAWVEAHPDIVSGLDNRLVAVENKLVGIGGEEEPATVTEAIGDAISAHEEVADGKYATKQEITDAGYAVAADVERDYAKKATTLEGYGITDAYDKTNTYSKSEVDELINNINEGNQESAGAVSTRLETYITSNDKEVAALKEKDAAHDTAIGENKTLAQKGVDDAAAAKTIADQNKLDIATLNGQLGTTNTNVTNVTERVAALEAEVGEVAESRIDALEGVTGQHTTDIGKNTAAITTLNTDTIPALQQSVTNEATARDNADKAILATIGTVEEGKTVVDMINAVAGTIDFTPYAKKDEVAATYATIEALNAETARADAAEKANAKAIADLAAGAVKDNTDAIAALDTTLKAALENDGEGLDSIKELALWIEEHETDVVPQINENKEAIAALAIRVGNNETAIAETLPAAIAAAEAAAKKYTDDTMVKADGTSIVNNEGTFSVGAVSTDNLVQGTKILVLNGGNANVQANA